MYKKMTHKLKKSNPTLRIIYYLIITAYIISLFFFIKSLLALKGIETVLRTIFIIFFIIYLIIYSFMNLLNLLQRKYKGLIITSIISLIFIMIFSVGSYYINYIYDNLNNMTEERELLYKSYLITLKDTEFSDDSRIGIIAKDVEADDHDLAQKLYAKEKLENEIIDYDDYIKLLDSLYNKEIEAIFVPGNYTTLFQSEEGFNNIYQDTKIIYEYSEKRENEDLNLTSDKDFSEPLTFLLMGVDSAVSGLNENAAFNGDTLMLITFNPQTLNTVMLSIPRDTYVPIACRNNAYAKINSAAAYGTSCVVNTINNLLDINVDYYVKVNFKGVVELVDAIGGVEVDVEKPYFNKNNGVDYHGQVCEQNSDRSFGNNIVCMDPGLQTLNGEQALAYSRNRHQYIGSDLDRIRHQQQVVEAIAGKALQFSSLKDLQKMLNAVSNNIATNMETNTILSGYQVVKNMIGNLLTGEELLNINKAYLETYSLSVYVPSQGRRTSAQGFYTESLEDIKKALKVSLGKEEEQEIKTFNFSVNNPYSVYSPGKGLRSGSSGELLPNFVGKSVGEVEKYCNEHNINLDIRYVDEDSDFYNASVAVGLVGNQSVHADVLLSTVNNLTIYIVNSTPKNNEVTENKNTNNNDNDDIDKVITDLIE